MSKILNGRELLGELGNPEVKISDFQVATRNFDNWSNIHPLLAICDFLSGDFQFRLKPKTRIINGFTVPEPLTDLKKGDIYFVASPGWESWTCPVPQTYLANSQENLWIFRGLCFDTQKAAMANAKAMCGINPEE